MQHLLHLGVTDALSPVERRYVRFANALMLGIAAFVLLHAAASLVVTGMVPQVPATVATLAVCAGTLGLHAARRYRLARLVLYASLLLLTPWSATRAPAFEDDRLYLLLLAFASFLLPRDTWERSVLFALSMGVFGALSLHASFSPTDVGRLGVVGGVLYLLGRLFARENDRVLHQLVAQNADLEARDQAISAQNEQLSALNERLSSLNRALVETASRAEEQAHRLDAMNTAKDRVVSVLSHDLRGPLSSLDALLEAYEEGAFTAEEVRELVPETRRALGTTREQLDDVLAWAQALLGVQDPHAATWLSEVVHRAAAQAQPRARAKGVALHVAVPSDLGVASEPASVLLLLRNLIGNALKFTPEGGTVTVEAERSGKGAMLRVTDTGVGIAPHRVARLNEGSSAGGTTLGTHGEKGSGLGLALCREVAGHFGGHLHVESTEGAGTRVTVAFPLARMAQAAAAGTVAPGVGSLSVRSA